MLPARKKDAALLRRLVWFDRFRFPDLQFPVATITSPSSHPQPYAKTRCRPDPRS